MATTKPVLINVVGPTAIGKTKLAIKLATHFNTEILSADSRQFYKELSIGTAAPNPEELTEAPHHFIQNRSITEDYSVGAYEREGLGRLKRLFEAHNVVIAVGGSGLYIDALNKGLNSFPKVDPKVKEEIANKFATHGIAYLQNELKTTDPEYYNRVDLNNHTRLLRALEVSKASGKPYSSFLKVEKEPRYFKSIYVGLTADREVLYDRINLRVDNMIAEGLLEEVKSVIAYRNHNALQTVGYKELFQYLDAQLSLEEAIQEIKKNSRRYAKRQITWFKRNPETIWVDFETPFSEILEKVKSAL